MYLDFQVLFLDMRCEFTINADMSMVKVDLSAKLPSNANISIDPKKKKEIIVFATKEHHCLSDILIQFLSQEIRRLSWTNGHPTRT